ncbi:TRAP transporter small permease subunit [Salipiger sp.]|uniref:TRAP transporter small permease subunit n=1 Tax=Salipiger sp. TaxID=2078585 RepID=UPI003A9767C6
MSFRILHGRIEKISQVASWIGGGAILFIAVMVSCDVLVRKMFGVTLQHAPELAGYIFAVAITMAYPLVLIRRANVRIDTAYTWLPPRVKAVLDVLGLVLFLGVAVMLARSASEVLLSSWEANSRSISPLGIRLWIPQLFWVGGFAVFVIVTGVVTLYAISALFRREWALVGRIAGVPSVAEAIEEEAQDYTPPVSSTLQD